MNLYCVDGIRHQTVAFGATPEEAVAQALASGEIGDWEAPEARLVPLPRWYTATRTSKPSNCERQ